MKNQKVPENQAVNVQTGREAKRIGVEIEFFNAHYQTVVSELSREGINVSYQGYTHAVMNSWKLVTDASVTTTGTGLNRGLELVSPPLTIAEMEVQLSKVCEVLNRLGAKVDKTCGVHVHHEIDDLNVDHIKNIYRLYTKHQNFINELMPASRRQSHDHYGYCRAVSPSEMTKIERATTIRQIQDAQETRYRVINFQAYVKYGTVEFRQHSGSTDFEKLMNWILITQSLIATAKTIKQVKPLSEAQKKRELEAFTKEIKIEYTKQAIYSRDRRQALKKAEKKAARTA